MFLSSAQIAWQPAVHAMQQAFVRSFVLMQQLVQRTLHSACLLSEYGHVVGWSWELDSQLVLFVVEHVVVPISVSA